MQTMQVVFYHTKDILKKRGWRMYAALFFVSMFIMLYTEGLQLLMDTAGTAYIIISFVCSLLNMVMMDTVLFLFVKAIRKQTFGKADLVYACKKAPLMIIVGFLLAMLQITFSLVCSLFFRIQWLYLIVYALIYAFFTIYNALVAYGIYDGVNFLQLFSGSLYIMKEHAKELLAASIFLILWYMAGQLLVPKLTVSILGSAYYAGAIIPGILRAFFISPLAVVQITLLNMVYYSVVYVLLLPVYCISARAYESEHYMCMPSGTRFLEEVCCNEKNK